MNLAKLLLSLALVSLLVLAGAWYFWPRRAPDGVYTMVARRINERSGELCDLQARDTRLGLAQVIDLLRPRIQGLWVARDTKEFPDFKMVPVGPLFLRVNREKQAAGGFDTSTWSWEEARATYRRTQADPLAPETNQRWRDLDTGVRFLLEKDAGRVLQGRPYLSPEKTRHSFRPSASVSRLSERVFRLKLDAGDFREDKEKLRALLEKEWSSPRHALRIEWVENDPQAYRVRAVFKTDRSYVNHRERVMVIANFAFTRTVAHELGHVLGFDDHYYSVWNAQNCYYTQQSRLADLMSNSARGRLLPKHWRLLDQAYPWRRPAAKDSFPYFFD